MLDKKTYVVMCKNCTSEVDECDFPNLLLHLPLLFDRLFKDEHLLGGLTGNGRTANLAHRVRWILGSIVKGHAGDLLLSGALIEGGALAEGRAVEMERHGVVHLVSVLHPVQANGVVDVGDGVLRIESSLADLFHLPAVSGLVQRVICLPLWPAEAHFVQRSGEALHDAVRVSVVVNL